MPKVAFISLSTLRWRRDMYPHLAVGVSSRANAVSKGRCRAAQGRSIFCGRGLVEKYDEERYVVNKNMRVRSASAEMLSGSINSLLDVFRIGWDKLCNDIQHGKIL